MRKLNLLLKRKAKNILITAEAEKPILNTLSNCYDETLNPQVTVEHMLCLRVLHTFVRDEMATYSETFFQDQSGLRGKRTTDLNIGTLIDNLTLYTNNKCGHTHGLLDTTWNIAGNGPNVRKHKLTSLTDKFI